MTTTTSELGIAEWVSPAERPAGLVVRQALLGCVGLLVFAACLLAWRRVAGALSRPLPAAALVGVGLSGAMVTAAVRLAWQAVRTDRRPAAIVWGALTVSLVTAAIAVSLPESSLAGMILLWSAILVEEGWAWGRGFFRAREPRAVRRAAPASARTVDQPCQPAAEWAADAPPQDHVTQQLTRLQQPDGTERLQGWLRTAFEAGQRLASLHIAFCPPFSHGPEANLQQIAGPEVRVKKVQVFPFGARFDLKLAVPAEAPMEVLLRFIAEAPGKEPGHGVPPSAKSESENGVS